MLRIHYVVSHFAECSENRPVTVWEMLINLLKSPIQQRWEKLKCDTVSTSRIWSTPKVPPIDSPIITSSPNEIGSVLRNNPALRMTAMLTDRHNDRNRPHRRTSALAEVVTNGKWYKCDCLPLPFFLLEVDVNISEVNPASFSADIEPEAFADASSAKITHQHRYNSSKTAVILLKLKSAVVSDTDNSMYLNSHATCTIDIFSSVSNRFLFQL